MPAKNVTLGFIHPRYLMMPALTFLALVYLNRIACGVDMILNGIANGHTKLGAHRFVK